MIRAMFVVFAAKLQQSLIYFAIGAIKRF